MRQARQKAQEHQVIIVLKGHRSFIAMPGGNSFFNSTGNPGMATGGSGDVLTGILTALLAQPLSAEQAALLGVYLHGLAGRLCSSNPNRRSNGSGRYYRLPGRGFQAIKKMTAYKKTNL